MTRTRLGLVGFCVVVAALMTMSVSSAQAALTWLILNSTGTEAKELKAFVRGTKDSFEITLLFKVVKLMVSVSCFQFSTAFASLSTGGTVEPFAQGRFSGCETRIGGGLVHCVPSSPSSAAGSVETNSLEGKLVLHSLPFGGSELLLELKPVFGTTLATLLMKGAECPLPEENPISGSFFLKDCENLAATHAVKHLVEQGPLTSLVVGSDTVEHLETSLIGSMWVELEGMHKGLKWAAMDA